MSRIELGDLPTKKPKVKKPLGKTSVKEEVKKTKNTKVKN